MCVNYNYNAMHLYVKVQYSDTEPGTNITLLNISTFCMVTMWNWNWQHYDVIVLFIGACYYLLRHYVA